MAAPALAPDPTALQMPQLDRLRLDQLCAGERFLALERLDAYADARQYDGLRYNWDGQLMGYAGEADISPGWYIPLDRRRPNVRYNMGKLIRSRLTAMALGEERWPEITVPGDPDAEDYVKALALEAKLQKRMQEARDRGGALGTAVVSFSFLDGKPRVKSHDAKHIFALRWADRDEHVLGAVLKAYRYTRTVWDSVSGSPKQKSFYFARFWDENLEVVWDPIPEEQAKQGNWSKAIRSYAVQHGYGECPVYWAQNQPDSEREDGVSDIEGLGDTFDQVNRLMSATTKGTIANVDPTLVIKDDQSKNSGVVRKGTGSAIYAPGGAEYLELRGESVKTANALADLLIQQALNVAGVVIGDPDKMGVRAQSSLALKMLYLPMCNQCDILRTQYGDLIVGVLRGMLRAARRIGQTAPGPILETSDGRRIQVRPVVVLPQRIEKSEPGSDGETAETMVDRVPGTSDRIELKWAPYFPLSMADIQAMVEAATKAKGQTISQRTAIKFTSTPFGVLDVDKEQAEIDVERERAAFQFGLDDPSAPAVPPGKPEEDEDEEPS